MPEVPNFKNYVADVVREEKANKPDYTNPLFEVDLANLPPLTDFSVQGVWNGEYLASPDPEDNESFGIPVTVDLDPTKFHTLLVDVEFSSNESRPDGGYIYVETMKSDNTLYNWYTLYDGETFVGRRTFHAVIGPGLEYWDVNAADEIPETRMFFEVKDNMGAKIYSVTLFEGDRSAFVDIGGAKITVADDGSLRTPPLIVDGTRLPKIVLNPDDSGFGATNITPAASPFAVAYGIFDPTVHGKAPLELYPGNNIVPDPQTPNALRLVKPGIYRISGAMRFTGNVTDRTLLVETSLMTDAASSVIRGKKFASPDQTEFAFSHLVVVTQPNTWMTTWVRWLLPGPVTALAPVEMDAYIALKLELS